jgi:transposase InsO family protein
MNVKLKNIIHIKAQWAEFPQTVSAVVSILIGRFKKIATDVAELRWGAGTTNERAYLTVYLDLFNNDVLTWNISLSPTVAFVVDPLKELLDNRPTLPYRMTVHSDQGVQYQNASYRNTLKNDHVFQSMSRKATCLDNAVVESFFHILKVGTVHNHHYDTYQELLDAVNEYIPYYNNQRIRTKLAGMSPVDFREHASQSAA